MRSIKVIAPIAFIASAAVVGLVAAMPAASSSASGSTPRLYRGPVAQATGGDVVNNVYPSIVQVRLDRTEAALGRAAALIDEKKGAASVVEFESIRTNLRQAWAAAKYVIQTAPPPVTEDSFGHADAAPDPVAGYAPAEATGVAVLTLQHDVISASLGLYDIAPVAVQTQLRATIRAAYNGRDAAIAYIHSVAPPPATDDAVGHASGGAVATDWATLMPTAALETADEIQQSRGMAIATPKLAPVFLKEVRVAAAATQNTINTYWPPVPADD
jgi:hypothetical protein